MRIHNLEEQKHDAATVITCIKHLQDISVKMEEYDMAETFYTLGKELFSRIWNLEDPADVEGFWAMFSEGTDDG